MIAHRSGPLKQVTRSSMSKKSKNAHNKKPQLSQKAVKLSKAEKKNLAKNLRKDKIKAYKNEVKLNGLFESPPHIISFLSIDNSGIANQIQEWICTSPLYKIIVTNESGSCCQFYSKQYNRLFRLNYYCLSNLDINQMISIAQTTTLFIIDISECHDFFFTNKFHEMIFLMKSYGLRDFFINVHSDDVKNFCQQSNSVKFEFKKDQILHLNSLSDFNLLLHRVSQMKIISNNLKMIQPKLIIDSYEYDHQYCILRVSGYVICNGITFGMPLYLPNIGKKPVVKVENSSPKFEDVAFSNEFTEMNSILYQASGDDIEEQLDNINAMNIAEKIDAIRKDIDIVDIENNRSESNISIDMPSDAKSNLTNITKFSRALINEGNYDSENTDDEFIDDKISEVIEQDFVDENEVICLNPQTSAKDKFKFYRGIENLKNYDWDLNEYLPIEYSQLNKFTNYTHQRKLILEECDKKHTLNKYCTLSLCNVSKDEFECFKSLNNPVATGLLKYEGLPSLITVNIIRRLDKDSTEFISGKTYRLQLGPITIEVPLIFSDHNFSSKYRYLSRVDNKLKHFSAHFYGPILITPCQIFILSDDEESPIIASGSIHSMDPNIVIYKRKQLCGRVHKAGSKSIVVQQMFHNRNDVDWFMNVPIFTRSGKQGFIVAKLGTHGDFKSKFEKKPKDGFVYMNLYKRIFPKYMFMYL